MPEPSARARRRTRRTRRLVVGGVATVVVLAAGTTAWAVAGGSGTSYRTATVGRGSVRQLLTTTGTLSPLHSADVDFQVAGTVKRIVAHQGQHVHAGATLATLDRASLAATLATARSTLSSAEATLADDESGEANSTQTTAATAGGDTATATDSAFVLKATTPSPSPSPTPSRGSGGGGSGGGGASSATISRDQAAVVAAQHQTDVDLATAKQALAATRTACAAPGSASCTSAAATLLADQTTVSTDEKAVLTAEQTLDTDTEKLLASGGGTTSTPTPRSSSGTTHSRASHSGSTATGSTRSGVGASSRVVTAATLASDEASIDTDRAAMATDRADLAEATLTSPIAGSVMAVTISKGDAVSGSSSSTSPAFIIKGAGHDEVTLSLTATQVRTVTKGMTATARPDGSNNTIAGRVIAIRAADSDSDYPVVVELDGSSARLVNGADAAVSLLLASAHDVMTVPTSAVHRSGSATYVELLNGGSEVRRTVVTGATGAALTQIKSGLSTGQRVVLANLDAAVPSSSNTLTRTGFGGRFGGAGGFGTGGFGTGGFGTGGFGGAGGFPGARSGTAGS